MCSKVSLLDDIQVQKSIIFDIDKMKNQRTEKEKYLDPETEDEEADDATPSTTILPGRPVL